MSAGRYRYRPVTLDRKEREAEPRHPAFARVDGMEVRRRVILGGDEHLDDVDPEKDASHFTS